MAAQQYQSPGQALTHRDAVAIIAAVALRPIIHGTFQYVLNALLVVGLSHKPSQEMPSRIAVCPSTFVNTPKIESSSAVHIAEHKCVYDRKERGARVFSCVRKIYELPRKTTQYTRTTDCYG